MRDDPRPRELAALPDPRLVGRGFLGQAGDFTEILLIRHGHIPQPRAANDDDSLTEMGREQAEVLAAFLAKTAPLDAVFSSPFRRTLETAEVIASRQSVQVEVLNDLREVEVYVPEGLTMRKYLGEERWTALQERMRRMRVWDARGELGESSASIRERVVAAMEDVISRHPKGRVAVVTHGPIITTYVAAIVQSPFDFIFQPKLTSISVIWARDDLRSVRVLNSTPHFGAL